MSWPESCPYAPGGGTCSFCLLIDELYTAIGHDGLPDHDTLNALRRWLLKDVQWTEAEIKEFLDMEQPVRELQNRRQPWALTVGFIGRYTLAVLQSADTAAGREPREGFNGAAVDFIFAKLEGRLGPDEAPERTAVIRVLRRLAPVRLRHRDT